MSERPEQPPCDVLRRSDGRPVLTLSAQWSGLPLGLYTIPAAAEVAVHVTPCPTLLVARRGHGQRWYRVGQRTHHLHTAPHMIELYPRALEFDRLRWLGEPGDCIAIQLTQPAMQRLAQREADIDFVYGHELFDERLGWLASELLAAATDGPANPLYVEGLSLAVIGRLQQRGWISRPAAVGNGKLDAKARRCVLDLIGQSLHEDLSVARLAAQAHMSPDHFAHCFKATFGVSPHRYVQVQRIAQAKRLLRRAELSISHVAMAVGFASQSHFTQVFRQHTGTTPRRWRHG